MSAKRDPCVLRVPFYEKGITVKATVVALSHGTIA